MSAAWKPHSMWVSQDHNRWFVQWEFYTKEGDRVNLWADYSGYYPVNGSWFFAGQGHGYLPTNWEFI